MLCHAMSCSLPPGSAPVTTDCDTFDTSLVSLLSLLHAGPLQPEFHPESSKTTDLQHGACCSCKRCKQAVESNCMRVLPQQDAPPERHLGPAALGTHHLNSPVFTQKLGMCMHHNDNDEHDDTISALKRRSTYSNATLVRCLEVRASMPSETILTCLWNIPAPRCLMKLYCSSCKCN